MALQTTDYNALTIKLNEWYGEYAKSRVADWVGKELFDVKETDWQVYDYAMFYGIAKFDRVAEGSQLPSASSSQGDTASATQRRFGGRVVITKDMRMFERYDQMQPMVRDAVNFAFDQIDQSQADLLTNGFSGTSYTDVYGYSQSNVAPDGVVFFSASHSNNLNASTDRNLIRNSAGTANPGLSRDAIVKARADARTHKDANRAVRPIRLNRLIVSAANEDLAERMVYTSGVQGTPNVDLNPLKGKVSNITVWERLDLRTGGTDTSAYWFMSEIGREQDTLKSPFAQKPMMGQAENINDSLNWEYPLDAYYTLFIGAPFHVWGSTGAN